ncbi:MAG: adenylyl-sulfate kinase [bacterium]
MTTTVSASSETCAEPPRMCVVLTGHVDHGKSTVLGRLLADTGSLAAGKLDAVAAACERLGQRFEHAFLADALRDERAQGITIDSARIFFRSSQREYLLVDAPGHVEFVKNMVTGAARASAALLVVDAEEGIQENSRRHAYLLSLLGVRHVLIIVNKMDLVGYSEASFASLVATLGPMLATRGVAPARYIPVAARDGDNVVHPSKCMPWYAGPTVLAALDELETEPPAEERPFRMPVQGVYRFPAAGHQQRIIAGTIASGSIAVGDEIEFFPSGKRSVVATIGVFPGHQRTAHTGDAIGITLRDQIYVKRGDLAARVADGGGAPPQVASRINVSLFWLGRAPLVRDKRYVLKIGTARTTMRLETVNRVVDTADSLDVGDAHAQSLGYNQTAECVLALERPIALDEVSLVQETSRFVVIDDHQIRGGGIVRGVLPASEDVAAGLHGDSVSAAGPGMPGAVLWLTGLSGAGKSTIAEWVVARLRARGHRTEHLDGDTIRDLFPDVGFDRASREAHIRRVGHLASRLEHHGIVVVASFIAPYESSRRFVRDLCANFVEVHVATPMSECARRDCKGLYARALSGSLKDFTGVDAPYEAPPNPELRIDTSGMSVEAAGAAVMQCLSELTDA